MDIITGTKSVKFYLLSGILLLEILLAAKPVICKEQDELHIEYNRVIQKMSLFNNNHSLWQRLEKFVGKNSQPALRQPMGVDARNGMLAIADASLEGVYLIDFSGETVELIRNKNVKEARIPVDVAIAKQKFYVTHSNNLEIDVFSFTGELLQVIKPNCNATRFTGITWNEPHLFVVDTPHHTVFHMDENGRILRQIHKLNTKNRALNFPTFVTVSGDQTLLISDTMNFRILTYSTMDDKNSSFGTFGVEPGQFNRPKGVAIDQNGKIYVVDSSFDNVQVFTSSGQLLTFFGENGSEASQFRMPTDIAIDGDKLYVSDTLNRRIQVFQIYYE